MPLQLIILMMSGNEFRQTAAPSSPPGGLEQLAGVQPLEQIMSALEVSPEDAGYVASLMVKCPVPGVAAEGMTLSDFMKTEHGQQHGLETLALAREEIEDGVNKGQLVDLETAMKHSFGSQLIRDKETGEPVTADSRPQQADAVPDEAEKK